MATTTIVPRSQCRGRVRPIVLREGVGKVKRAVGVSTSSKSDSRSRAF
jgi:hypothetical protein